jgi:hypothetical protein
MRYQPGIPFHHTINVSKDNESFKVSQQLLEWPVENDRLNKL